MRIVADISYCGTLARFGGASTDVEDPVEPVQREGIWVDVDLEATFKDADGQTAGVYGQRVRRISDQGSEAIDAVQYGYWSRPLLGRAPVGAASGGAIDQGTGPAFVRFEEDREYLSHEMPRAFAGDVMVFGRSGTWLASDVIVEAGQKLRIPPEGQLGVDADLKSLLGDVTGWAARDGGFSEAEKEALCAHHRARGAKAPLGLGPELLANNDFSAGASGWSVGSGWSISNGIAVCSANTSSTISQSGFLEPNKAYLVSFAVRVAPGRGGNIKSMRRAEFHLLLGSVSRKIVGENFTSFEQSVVMRTGSSIGTGSFAFPLSARRTINVEYLSLREIRPQEDW